MLRENATPMTRFDLYGWLETNLANTDISANVSSCFDNRGFVANEVILSDKHGASRKITIPVLADSFTFDSIGITNARYNRFKRLSERVGSKNMWVVEYKNGLLLVSYNTVIAYYHTQHNTVYFMINAYNHSSTTTSHISEFLSNYCPTNALKMFALTK